MARGERSSFLAIYTIVVGGDGHVTPTGLWVFK
jgi:hypothetical protein